MQPFGSAKAVVTHKAIVANIEMEYNGRTIPLSFSWNKVDLSSVYGQLKKAFDIPDDTMITGFICDTPNGGLICPFRMFEGLRGEPLFAARFEFFEFSHSFTQTAT